MCILIFQNIEENFVIFHLNILEYIILNSNFSYFKETKIKLI